VIREYALLGLLAGLWGSSYLAAKVALETISPLTLAAARVTIAAFVLLLVLRLSNARLPRDDATWRLLFAQSLLNSTLAWSIVAQLAVLFSACLYGLAAIHGRRLGHVSPIVTAAATTLLAAACLVPASLLIERPWALAPSARSLVAASVLAVFCTALALLIYFRLLRTLGAMGVTSQSYLRAGVAVMLGIVVLGERVSPAVGIGLAAIILGVAAINARRPAA
jgi:drug/metabolite transporter (DMT)-like permease